MNPARLVVLIIALGAGGVAAWLASTSGPTPTAKAPPQQQLKTVEVLVAKADIPLGQKVDAGQLQWQSWPASAASSNFIRRSDRPDAIKQLGDAIARSPFVAGEPIRETKLVTAKGSGFMAAILPAGMRAISIEISPETGAGGFILPNDRVDVILSRRKGGDDGQTGASSEIILTNVRVLAIDQKPGEKEGQNTVVGKTATLELRPDQAESLARAKQTGTLSLALRSIADAATSEDDARRSSVNVVRFGVSTTSTMTK